MTVYQQVRISDATSERTRNAAYAWELTSGKGIRPTLPYGQFEPYDASDTRLTEWQREQFPRYIRDGNKSILESSFNPDTDVAMAGATESYGPNAIRRRDDLIGRCWKIEHKSTYYGDGDSGYWCQALCINDDGTLFAVTLGSNGYYPTSERHANGSTPDAADELIDAHFAQVEATKKAQAIASFNQEARTVEKGKLVRVVSGRKVPIGTTGRVFWTGFDNWGNEKCGFNDEAGTTHWTATRNVDVIVEPFED